jgi:hypothetical protein
MADVAPSAPAETTSTASAADTAVTPSTSTTETPSVTSTESTGDMVSAAAEIYHRHAAAESPSAAPSEPTPPAQAATAPAPTPETPADVPPTRGPIPFDRHKAVITNTRNEARRETLTEFGIADNMSAKDVSTGLNLVRLLNENPALFVQMVQSQLGGAATPATAPAAAATPKPAEDPEPEPDIPLQDGRFTRSADNLREWHQWNARQMQAQFDKTYGPIRDAHELQQLQVRAQAEAKQLVGTAKQWPLFTELKPYIATALKDHRGPLTATSLHDAYITAFQQHGVRLQREGWERERNGLRVDELNRKAGAATARPGAPQPLTPRTTRDKSMVEVATEIWRQAGAE